MGYNFNLGDFDETDVINRRYRPRNLTELIVPNAESALSKYKNMRIVAILMIIVGVILCIVIGTKVFPRTFGRGSVGKFIFFIPALMFVCGGSLMTSAEAKYNACKTIVAVINEIKCVDYVLIATLFSDRELPELGKLAFVKKLLATGNLEGYEIVGDLVVAKKSLRMPESTAIRHYAEYKGISDSISPFAPKPYDISGNFFGGTPFSIEEKERFLTHCPSCGAPIDEIGQKYCSYCGVILKK